MSTKQTIYKSLVILCLMLAFIGFAAGVNAFFIPFVQKAFKISTAMSYMVMTATYAAYIIFGIPSGLILTKLGYKGGMAVGLTLIGFGFFLIACAGSITNFPLFLLALFINGMGQCLMTGAVSTYTVLMGPVEKTLRRGGLQGVSNKFSFALASFVLSGFMDLTNAHIEDVIIPFCVMASILVVVGVLTFFAPLPEIKEQVVSEDAQPDVNSVIANSKTSIFQFPHLFLGFLALFFYMGNEVIALGSINDYATSLNLPSPASYVWFASAGMVVGYISGAIFVPKYLKLRQALIICTYLGIITTILIFIVPGSINIYLVALLGLANSLLYGAIWPLAIADLGKFTKTGTSILVTAITGAAVIPLLFGYFADHSSYRTAYLICLPAYLYILYYAVYGCKIRKYSLKKRDNDY